MGSFLFNIHSSIQKHLNFKYNTGFAEGNESTSPVKEGKIK